MLFELFLLLTQMDKNCHRLFMNSFLIICGNLRELVLSIKHKLAQMTTNYQKFFLLKPTG